MFKYDEKLKYIVNFVIKIVLFLLLSIAILNITILRDNIEFKFNYKLLYFIFVIYFIFIFLVMEYYNKNNKKKNKVINISLLVTFFILQLIYAFFIRSGIGFDAGVIYHSAIDLVKGNFSNSEYFSSCGNNIFLLLAYELIFRIVNFFGCEYFLEAQIFVNIIMIDIALIYMYKVCMIMFEKKYAKICNFISIPMLGLTPYIVVGYSDMLSLIFPIAIFYNYLGIKNLNPNKELTLKKLIYITILAVIGYLVKPTNVIILIAIFIIECINLMQYILLNKKSIVHTSEYKKYIKYIFYILITFILVYGSFYVYKNIRLKNYISKEQIQNNTLPMTHYFMMGLKPENVQTKHYGCYFEPDVKETKSHIGIEAKKEFNIKEAKNRIKSMGVKGYIYYLYNKYTWIISDGAFFYGKEGNFYSTPPFQNNKIAKVIQNYSYMGMEGYNKITINIMQGIWLLTLFFSILDICVNFINEKISNIQVLRLSICGIIFFILLFEARSRYLINYLPIIIILATSGIINLYKLIKKENFTLISEKIDM